MNFEKLYADVRSHCENEASGHDWWHIQRVVTLAKHIAASEHANAKTVEVAAVLHDLDDWKFSANADNCPNARKLLCECGFDKNQAEAIIDTIGQVSFKGAGVNTQPTSIEAMVVQDADRIDAIGAIGIARTFAYGGSKGRPMYNPDIEPQMHNNFEQYKTAQSHTINHFYEKLLLLKDRLNTPSARKIAEDRHNFMLAFLNQFYDEWNFTSTPQ